MERDDIEKIVSSLIPDSTGNGAHLRKPFTTPLAASSALYVPSSKLASMPIWKPKIFSDVSRSLEFLVVLFPLLFLYYYLLADISLYAEYKCCKNPKRRILLSKQSRAKNNYNKEGWC